MNDQLESKRVQNYYDILELHPSASEIAIRRSYRKLSKQLHPDTTELPAKIAKAEFQRLNEAYATLSNPDRRSLYDLEIGYSRINVIQAPRDWEKSEGKKWSTTAYLDPTDRPLSSGEIFVLVLLGLTMLSCLALVIAVAYLRGEPW
jgi:DnaJ-domain-containing protein 1